MNCDLICLEYKIFFLIIKTSEKAKRSGKEKSREYYQANKEIIKEKAKIRYQNLSEEQKHLQRQYSRDRYKKLVELTNKIK